MMPQPTKSRKPAYRPHIRKVADNAYTCQSERWTYVLYLVTIRPDGATVCDCEAGSHARDCKHQRAVRALMAYNAKPQHIQPATPRYHDATALLEAFGA
jgi:hypothetical protein